MHTPTETGYWPKVELEARWKELLRQACEVLSLTSDYVVTSYSVTRRLTDGPDEACAAVALARRLAQEHGLLTAAVIFESILTIHFRRAAHIVEVHSLRDFAPLGAYS